MRYVNRVSLRALVQHCKSGEVSLRLTSLLCLGVAYVVPRLIAWRQALLVEDHDSIAYLSQIKTLVTFDLSQIIKLDPQTAPLYPLLGAIVSLQSSSFETAARLTSLLVSCLLFLALYGIGKQLGSTSGVILGLIILSFSPTLIPLSISILAEPIYLGITYLGLWLFLIQYERPNARMGTFLGATFGLSFLTRTEGIVYLGILPLLQITHFLLPRIRRYPIKRLLAWNLGFVIAFTAIVAPQVWRASRQMGHLSLNTRQVWFHILQRQDGMSYDEKIYGLDFSPSQTNLDYLRNHPEAIGSLPWQTQTWLTVKTMLLNFDVLYYDRLPEILGPVGIVLLGFGILGVFRSRGLYVLCVVCVFVAGSLIAPLAYTTVNFPIRRIALVSPLLMLIEGFGIITLVDLVLLEPNRHIRRRILTIVLLLMVLGPSTLPVIRVFRGDHETNKEYTPRDLEQSIQIVRESERKEFLRPPVVLSRKAYLAYFSDARWVPAPFAGDKKLIEYIEMNEVDFVFLEHRLLARYPFLSTFQTGEYGSRFRILYRQKDSFGGLLELYRVIPARNRAKKNEDMQTSL